MRRLQLLATRHHKINAVVEADSKRLTRHMECTRAQSWRVGQREREFMRSRWHGDVKAVVLAVMRSTAWHLSFDSDVQSVIISVILSHIPSLSSSTKPPRTSAHEIFMRVLNLASFVGTLLTAESWKCAATNCRGMPLIFTKFGSDGFWCPFWQIHVISGISISFIVLL